MIDLMEALRASLERKAAAPSKANGQKSQPEADTRKPPKRAAVAEAPAIESAPAPRARARK